MLWNVHARILLEHWHSMKVDTETEHFQAEMFYFNINFHARNKILVWTHCVSVFCLVCTAGAYIHTVLVSIVPSPSQLFELTCVHENKWASHKEYQVCRVYTCTFGEEVDSCSISSGIKVSWNALTCPIIAHCVRGSYATSVSLMLTILESELCHI